MRALRMPLAAACVASLVACTHYEPLSLHGAASMRVEMEVYKGPATLSRSAQIGQTAAVLADLVRALHTWNLEAKGYFDGYSDDTPRWIAVAGTCRAYTRGAVAEPKLADLRDCDELAGAIASSDKAIGQVCFLLATPGFARLAASVSLPKNTCELPEYQKRWRHLYEANTPWGQIAGTSPPPLDSSSTQTPFEQLRGEVEACRKRAEDILKTDFAASPPEPVNGRFSVIDETFACLHEPVIIAMESVSTQLRATAMRAAEGTVRHVPVNRQFRGLIVTYAAIAAEYGGQISARVNVLNKQLVDGKKPGNLPMGDYLRGAAGTDFINLIQWLEAADRHAGVPFAKIPDLASRVRMADQLNADAYWEKFNEVYASGQGDVAMAFIKNDVGNWDLKSFSNDPSKLLASYRKTTDALLASAVRLASKAASGPAGAAVSRLSSSQKALDLANRLAGGETGGTSALDTAAMHDRVVARIRARQAALNARLGQLQQEQAQLQQTVAMLQGQAGMGDMARQVELAAAQQRLASVEQQVKSAPEQALSAIRDILEDHSLVLAAAQEAIAVPAAPAPAP